MGDRVVEPLWFLAAAAGIGMSSLVIVARWALPSPKAMLDTPAAKSPRTDIT
jgi:hypothetical protein